MTFPDASAHSTKRSSSGPWLSQEASCSEPTWSPRCGWPGLKTCARDALLRRVASCMTSTRRRIARPRTPRSAGDRLAHVLQFVACEVRTGSREGTASGALGIGIMKPHFKQGRRASAEPGSEAAPRQRRGSVRDPAAPRLGPGAQPLPLADALCKAP